MKDTSSIGQIGETAVMQKLIRAGWHVLIPYGNSASYDLAAEKDGRIVRIQVRTTQSDGRVIRVNCRTKHNRVRAKTGQYDVMVVYDLSIESAFVIRWKEIAGKAAFYIRLEVTRSGQTKGTHPAKKFWERWDKLAMV